MRILGFSQKWGKLQEPEFTTFRFTRKDKDWQLGEVVQVVFKPRSKGREILGVAEIITKEVRWIFSGKKPRGAKMLTPQEARRDGFKGYVDMAMWLCTAHKHSRLCEEPMNKLTLRWIPLGADGVTN